MNDAVIVPIFVVIDDVMCLFDHRTRFRCDSGQCCRGNIGILDRSRKKLNNSVRT